MFVCRFTFGEDVLIKKCPVCNIFIEKNNGCAQMTCRNCSHVFCWYCLKILDVSTYAFYIPQNVFGVGEEL